MFYLIKLNALSHCQFTLGQEVAGKVSLKHIYEIAQIKSQDPAFENVSLQEVCKRVISTAHTCGIEIVKHLDEGSYREFLDARREVVARQQQDLQEQRESKMLRL